MILRRLSIGTYNSHETDGDLTDRRIETLAVVRWRKIIGVLRPPFASVYGFP